MIFPKRFFELNWRFALRVAEVSNRPLAGVLLDCTHFYVRFKLGRSFDAAHPVWQEYLRGLEQAQDPVEWTYQLYLQRQAQGGIRPDEPAFGCFSYTLLPGQKIRVHFHNAEAGAMSPLDQERVQYRIAELTAMFARIKDREIGVTNVIGCSWLYNRAAYRRLFPPVYLSTARISDNEFRYLTLWGQFIARDGQVKEDLATEFINRLYSQRVMDGLHYCFPFQALRLECEIQPFFMFYGV